MRLIRILTVTAGLGIFGLAAGGAGCNPVSDFQCSTDEDCIGQGEGGQCETNSFCTFPDAECPSGRRWHDRASSLADMCLGDEGGVTATDTDDPSVGTGSSGTTDEPTTGVEPTTDDGSTTDPLTTGDPPTTGDPTTGDPATTDATGTDGSGGMATCDEMYGGAADYILCEEAADSCRFNVTIGMASNCTAVCESFGGTCNGAQFNDEDPCVSTGDATCDDMTVNDLMCICTR